MGKKKRKKNKLFQVEKFVICPNCKKPFFRKSMLKIKGAASDEYCRNCGFDFGNV